MTPTRACVKLRVGGETIFVSDAELNVAQAVIDAHRLHRGSMSRQNSRSAIDLLRYVRRRPSLAVIGPDGTPASRLHNIQANTVT